MPTGLCIFALHFEYVYKFSDEKKKYCVKISVFWKYRDTRI